MTALCKTKTLIPLLKKKNNKKTFFISVYRDIMHKMTTEKTVSAVLRGSKFNILKHTDRIKVMLSESLIELVSSHHSLVL